MNEAQPGGAPAIGGIPTVGEAPVDPKPGPGRPRNLSPDIERRRILDATIEVLRRHQYASSSVRDILAEAGLGTRSFYRHFQSKDDLLWAVYRREAESFARRVAAAAAASSSALDAIGACVEEYLSVFYRRRWAERASALQFAQFERDDGHDADRLQAIDLAVVPLAAAIRAAVEEGVAHSVDPELDARTIRDMAFSVARMPGMQRPKRLADAVDHCLRYVRGALGIE
ncbi:TetR/AcrR family transcriptional regulator [Acidiferrimicrobium sp. IK]|uniref:TetR/AcrR family transcriptional regulator n=1 Tax=Acidiferrimicrobium sp. IK TaxID=2871700 RepID=UPI0021CAFFD5|nr:TetR/AcrR family transcriptional regulator [Acidiferrimicrobium sp. IK]MCU4186858.1 TetR/AcrR family transcriptional regulator [Acidiferrimicrobium sp. IK]